MAKIKKVTKAMGAASHGVSAVGDAMNGVGAILSGVAALKEAEVRWHERKHPASDALERDAIEHIEVGYQLASAGNFELAAHQFHAAYCRAYGSGPWNKATNCYGGGTSIICQLSENLRETVKKYDKAQKDQLILDRAINILNEAKAYYDQKNYDMAAYKFHQAGNIAGDLSAKYAQVVSAACYSDRDFVKNSHPEVEFHGTGYEANIPDLGCEAMSHYHPESLKTLLNLRLGCLNQSLNQTNIKIHDAMIIDEGPALLHYAQSKLSSILDSNLCINIVPLILQKSDVIYHWCALLIQPDVMDKILITYIDPSNDRIPDFVSNLMEQTKLSSSTADLITFQQPNVAPQEFSNCGPHLIELIVQYLNGKSLTKVEIPQTFAPYLHSILYEQALIEQSFTDPDNESCVAAISNAIKNRSIPDSKTEASADCVNFYDALDLAHLLDIKFMDSIEEFSVLGNMQQCEV